MLTEAQRAEPRGSVRSGVAPARVLIRARILLKADHSEGSPGWSAAAVAGALDVNPSTVLRVWRQFVAEGLEPTLERERPHRADAGRPVGCPPRRPRLLANGAVRLEIVEASSHETVRRALKQTTSSRG